jgi:hypothetical protein
MSQQLLDTITMLNGYNGPTYVAEALIEGMRQLVAVLPCSDAERTILLALPDACVAPTPLYSVALARVVMGKELAATATAEILLEVLRDDTCDLPSRFLSMALARELHGVLKIIDALELDPMDGARLLLDGPLP